MTATPATAKPGPKERRFLDVLRDIFVGVKVDGQSGFINLMRIKAAYFQKVVEPALMQDIARALKDFPEFREELFDKLYSFFSRYFSRSGSICFAYTPQHMSVYEKVYTDEQDVVLFWKTHMLYYVKTDRLFRDLKVDVDGHTFFFDCTSLEHKKANEKRELVFTLDKVEADGAIRLLVAYSERGRVTKMDEMLKALKKAEHPVKEAVLDKALKVFARQSEVDYFINKDAKSFLREQFDLWMYQYVFKDATTWSAPRIHQLQALKDTAFKLIDFISQFEDELVRIWNKPKFVRGSFYVVTLDRLAAKHGGLDLIADILKHPGLKHQVKEWRDLSIVSPDFDPKEITAGRGKDRKLVSGWKSLPIDTRYFEALELRLLGLFENLDEEIDGRLIKSENYQALNTLREKFKGRVKCCYIDPPYNTGSDSFIYRDAFQHSSWVSMIQDRIALAYLNLTIVFTDAAGILNGNALSSLNVGLYNSGGTAPLQGLDQSGLSSSTTFNRGGARLWQGYGASMGNTLFTRPQQTAVTDGTGNDNNGNQDLLFNGPATGTFKNPPGTTVGFIGGSTPSLTAGQQYTVSYTLTLAGANDINVHVQLFAGVGTAGTLLGGVGPGDFSGGDFVSSSFDAMAFGWHYAGTAGDPASSIDVNSIAVTSSVPEPSAIALMGLAAVCVTLRIRGARVMTAVWRS